MQTRNRLFDDIAKVANSAAGTIAGLKEEIENMIRHRMESFVADMNLVTREEFNMMKSMVSKSRSEQERLKTRVSDLEKKLTRLSKPSGQTKRTAKGQTKRTAKKKTARAKKKTAR